VRGEGPWLFTADGTRYLDAYNNVAVVGHAHPAVVQAVSRQLDAVNTHSRYLHTGIVELAERLNPDLVIMDVKMPRRDGIDAAAEIAQKRIAPIVVLTAFSQRELVERARDAGAMAYLVKPFSITDLIPAIELAVSRFGELAALENEVATLSDRLETRKLVERAKGLLQANQGMSEPEAFKWIQRAAMDRRTTMKRVAEVVLETLDAPGDA